MPRYRQLVESRLKSNRIVQKVIRQSGDTEEGGLTVVLVVCLVCLLVNWKAVTMMRKVNRYHVNNRGAEDMQETSQRSSRDTERPPHSSKASDLFGLTYGGENIPDDDIDLSSEEAQGKVKRREREGRRGVRPPSASASRSGSIPMIHPHLRPSSLGTVRLPSAAVSRN